MTVSAISNKIIYSGNGATTVWSFSFPGVAASDLAVYYTNASGNITTLASNLYTVALNAASGTNPTGSGGTITYPLVGSPIAVGTFLTILRTLPLTQATSLANQGTLYQTVIEAALDNVLMQVQQLNELLGRQITVAVSDSTLVALPPAAQRALLYMAFDSSGNPIAVAGTTSTNPVSSAMTPVVSAASLAVGRTAFGLGAAAVEGIGAGLQDDGAGNLRARFTPVADSINQSVVAGFHFTERHATGALTYTCPATSTLFSGFGFFVYALTASITFAINGADAFSGGVAGTSLVIPPGTQAYISTDGAGTWFIRENNIVSLNSALNLQINATVAANAMTVAIKDRNGNDPSTASPVMLAFRDPTITGGDPVIRVITSALSIVIPNTATLNTTSAQGNRLWLVCFDNGGTPVLGVVNCSDSTHIYPLNESNIASGTAIAGGSNTGGVIYSNGTVTNKAFRILGFIESTQATAGAWATAPSLIQLFGPGIKKPGDVVQTIVNNTTAAGSTASAAFADLSSGQNSTITVTAAANLVRLIAIGVANASAAGTNGLQWVRGANVISQVIITFITGTGGPQNYPVSFIGYEIPGAGAQTYKIQGKTTGGNLSYPAANTGASLILEEIMG